MQFDGVETKFEVIIWDISFFELRRWTTSAVYFQMKKCQTRNRRWLLTAQSKLKLVGNLHPNGDSIQTPNLAMNFWKAKNMNGNSAKLVGDRSRNKLKRLSNRRSRNSKKTFQNCKNLENRNWCKNSRKNKNKRSQWKICQTNSRNWLKNFKHTSNPRNNQWKRKR